MENENVENEKLKIVTVADLIKKKEQLLNKRNKTAQLYVPSFGGSIIVKTPDDSLIVEAIALSKNEDSKIDADQYILLECIVNPNLKDPQLLVDYKCETPLQLISIFFDEGEIRSAVEHLTKLAGLTTEVTLVDHLKN